MRLCAISVDLDEIPHYFAIHGLAAPPAEDAASRAVYDVAIDRLQAFAERARLPITFFAVGSDLARPSAAARLAKARADGHEIANHSLDHRYDLVRLGREAIRAQIEGGAEAIARAVGERPKGFRAPGYTITDEVFEVLAELGVAYDSSVFPCPPYYAAKAAALGAIALRGRESRSILDNPSVLLAPTRPYFVGRPYWRRATASDRGRPTRVLELPVQVTRGARLPFFGTSVTMAGASRAKWLARMCVGEPLVNLELHGIDVLDASDGLEALRPHQVDVRVSVAKKLEALEAVVDVLRGERYSFVTLAEAAERLS